MQEIKMYKCDFCEKTFLDKEECKSHERVEHLCIKCLHHKIVGQYSDEIECDAERCEYAEGRI